MIRISFRQTMLAGFLVIALLLSWAAVRSWLVLEQFVDQSRQGSEQALQLSAAIQELGERTVDLERGARQFVILGDLALLNRFAEHQVRALNALARLESIAGEAVGKPAGAWRQTVDGLARSLRRSAREEGQGAGPAGRLAPELSTALVRLAELNHELDQIGRHWIDGQQATMLARLEQNRRLLAYRLAAAVLGAFLVALAMNWWLSRPLESLEQAIERLGESRFDDPVSVGGPADLRRVGRRLDWLRRRLGELEAEREQTLRHVSHELKTPLTGLREGIALLQDGVVGALDGAQQEVVDILQHKVMTLQSHIEGLLRLNAAAFESRRPCYQPVPLRQLLADVARGRDLQIKVHELTVLAEAPEVVRVLDAEKLRVALDNLLSNAIDFSPAGGVIRLQASLLGKRLRIACIDQGPGVAAEDAARIFEPFVQGRRAPPTPRQGSGVGLSIVRELMTAMGGWVMLVPGEGREAGANFTIELPCEARNYWVNR